MFSHKSIVILFLIVTTLVSPGCPDADELAQKGRLIFSRYEKAVVKVTLIIRFRLFMNGSEKKSRESITETTGTILTPDGLTLISLNTTEPDKMAEEKIKRKTNSKMKLESELGDTKIILFDGTEIPAEIVLRDLDLDLAFVRPSKPVDQALPAIGAVKTGPASLLDTIFILGRIGKLGSRTATVSMDRIHAIIDKPRTVYLPLLTRELGAPVFSADGNWIGNILLRYNRMGNTTPGAMFIILPAADIMEVAGQAPQPRAGIKPESAD